MLIDSQAHNGTGVLPTQILLLTRFNFFGFWFTFWVTYNCRERMCKFSWDSCYLLCGRHVLYHFNLRKLRSIHYLVIIELVCNGTHAFFHQIRMRVTFTPFNVSEQNHSWKSGLNYAFSYLFILQAEVSTQTRLWTIRAATTYSRLAQNSVF